MKKIEQILAIDGIESKMALRFNLVIEKAEDQYGNTFDSDFIYESEEGGVFYRQSVNCWSSQDLDLGTCRCASHDPWSTEPCSMEELKQYNINLTNEQHLAQSLAIAKTSIQELEEFCSLSYKFDVNPLPSLRKIFGGWKVVYMIQNDQRSVYYAWDETDPPTICVEHNPNDNTVWIAAYHF